MSPSRGLGTVLLLTAVLWNVSSAQSLNSSSTALTPSTVTRPTVHVVAVGPSGDHQFHPNVTIAEVGDIVSFRFYPTNHSVVRGEYVGSDACAGSECNPCVPYELIHPDDTEKGFHSLNVLTQLQWNSSGEVWFYCNVDYSI
jgi:plastocyanin